MGKQPLTLNTDGTYLLKGLAYAEAANADAASPLYGLVQLDNQVVAGHSMGATCSINAASKRLPAHAVKLVITQHPGICGPFGPPPWPSTWMPSDLVSVTSKFPTLFTTATNDGAFWPAPHTAEHELGCVQKAAKDFHSSKGLAFVQWSAEACKEDGMRLPFKDEGHICPFKSAPETGWFLTAIKLYAQQQGASSSNCYSMLWGSGKDSLQADGSAELVKLFPPGSSSVESS